MLLSLVMFAACIAGIQGLQCYSCNYTNVFPSYMSFCGDPFDATDPEAKRSTVPCDGVCIASKGRIYYDDGYLEGLSRGCHANMQISDCANACGSTGEASGCEHCCDTDLCNSASSVTFNLIAAVAMLVSAWFALAK